jgi:hypothetical protein
MRSLLLSSYTPSVGTAGDLLSWLTRMALAKKRLMRRAFLAAVVDPCHSFQWLIEVGKCCPAFRWAGDVVLEL